MKKITYKKQQGIATVLIVLLVGVTLTATTLGVVHSIKSTQQKQISSHALTNAQSAAWMLAEATRLYLETLDATTLLTKIGSEFTPNLPASYAHLVKANNESTILIDSATPAALPGSYDVNIIITARDSLSASTSTLNLVFSVVTSSSGSECPDIGGSQFTGLTHGENLTINFDGAHDIIRVDGSYGNPTKAAAVNGLRRIEATGDIYLKGTGDGATVELVKGNGNVYIEQSSNLFANVEAGGDLETASNAVVDNAIAAGNVIWGANRATAVNMVQAGVPVTGKGIRTDRDGTFKITNYTDMNIVMARGDMDLGEFRNINEAYSKADINIGKGGTQFLTAFANGDINCNDTNITLNSAAAANIDTDCTTTNTAPLVIPPFTPYTPIELKPSLIADADAYPANYSFSHDGTNMIVKVRNINGLPDNDYILYDDLTSTPKITNGLKNIDGSPLTSADGSEVVFSLCNPNGDTKRCINFKAGANLRILTDAGSTQPKDADGNIIQPNALTNTPNDFGVIEVAPPSGIWEITNDTKQLPPGIYYFDRDLRINPFNDAVPINGFLSAGDIQIQNSAAALYALNGIPAGTLCENKPLIIQKVETNGDIDVVMTSDTTSTEIGVFPEQFDGYPYPTNFCNDDGTKYRTTVPANAPAGTIGALPYIGQFALMAGQENNPTPDDGSTPNTYQGGDIYIQSSSTIYGRVIAGNSTQLVTGANLDIYGSIGSEARADGKSGATNDLNGTINLHTNYLENLDASTGAGGPCKIQPGAPNKTSLLWSRYL